MKVTLSVFSYITHANEFMPEHNNSLPALHQNRMANAHQRSLTPERPHQRPCAHSTRTYGSWNALLSRRQAYPPASHNDMLGLGGAKKTPWLNSHSYPPSVFAPALLGLRSTFSVPMTANQSPSSLSLASGVLLFSFSTRELQGATARIKLTAIEAMLIKTLTLSESRICSKHELILGIEKDINTYNGLEMCLSRLQNKFRAALGERLFRSVRNRGYCLVQDVKTVTPLNNAPLTCSAPVSARTQCN